MPRVALIATLISAVTVYGLAFVRSISESWPDWLYVLVGVSMMPPSALIGLLALVQEIATVFDLFTKRPRRAALPLAGVLVGISAVVIAIYLENSRESESRCCCWSVNHSANSVRNKSSNN